MYWVIQSNMYAEENYEHLLAALDRFKLPYSVHKVVPFVGTLEPECNPPAGSVIVMGSTRLARVAQERGWKPGSFLNENFDYFVQRKHWGRAMLNYHSITYKFGSVQKMFWEDKPFFIRPMDDSKAFAGMVTDWPSYVEWRDKVAKLTPEDDPTLTLDTKVIVGPVMEIYREYRLFVTDQRVVTASLYKIGSRPQSDATVEPAILAFGEELAKKWSPAEAYAMDIADTPRGLKVIEVNNINSAGWYKADMNKLVAALEEMW